MKGISLFLRDDRTFMAHVDQAGQLKKLLDILSYAHLQNFLSEKKILFKNCEEMLTNLLMKTGKIH